MDDLDGPYEPDDSEFIRDDRGAWAPEGLADIEAEPEEDEDLKAKSLPRKVQLPLPSLTEGRWREPIVDVDAERQLIQWAQAGDKRSGEELVKRFHRLIVSIARKTKF